MTAPTLPEQAWKPIATRQPLPQRAAREAIPGIVRWMLLLAAFAASATLMFVAPTPARSVISLTVLLVVLLSLVSFDFLHPYTWFGIFFYLYAIGLPVLVAMNRLAQPDYLADSMQLQWIALVSMAVVVGPTRVPTPDGATLDPRTRIPARILLLVLMLLSIPYLGAIYFGGYTTKYQILASGLAVLRLDVVYPLAAPPLAILLGLSFAQKKIPVSASVVVVGWAVLSLLVTGERDHMLRFLFVAAALYHAWYRRIGALTLIAGVVGMMLMLIVLSQVKAVATRGAYNDITLADPIAAAFRDEFISAGRNIAVLLRNEGDWEPMHGETLTWTVLRAARPNAIVNDNAPTSSSWFNERYYPGIVSIGGGVGFALVGEGYLNFGVPGVVAWFMALGLLLRWLYRRSATSAMWLLVYALTWPVVVYALREDSAAILSQGLKHVALPLLAIQMAADVRWERRHLAPSKLR